MATTGNFHTLAHEQRQDPNDNDLDQRMIMAESSHKSLQDIVSIDAANAQRQHQKDRLFKTKVGMTQLNQVYHQNEDLNVKSFREVKQEEYLKGSGYTTSLAFHDNRSSPKDIHNAFYESGQQSIKYSLNNSKGTSKPYENNGLNDVRLLGSIEAKSLKISSQMSSARGTSKASARETSKKVHQR